MDGDDLNFFDKPFSIKIDKEGSENAETFLRDWSVTFNIADGPMEKLLAFLGNTGFFPSLPQTMETLLGSDDEDTTEKKRSEVKVLTSVAVNDGAVAKKLEKQQREIEKLKEKVNRLEKWCFKTEKTVDFNPIENEKDSREMEQKILDEDYCDQLQMQLYENYGHIMLEHVFTVDYLKGYNYDGVRGKPALKDHIIYKKVWLPVKHKTVRDKKVIERDVRKELVKLKNRLHNRQYSLAQRL